MQFDAINIVRVEFSEEEFLRHTLIDLGYRPDTPLDIVHASFGKVRQKEREIIVCTANVSGKCNAAIGFDRQEAYTAYESYREKVGNSYVTRQRPVTKYRTVTDWQPYATTYSGNATCVAYNGDDDSLLEPEEAVLALTTANRDNIYTDPNAEATVSPDGLYTAQSRCQVTVEVKSVKFPGDRHKDAQYDSDIEIEHLSCYKVPTYEVDYTYEGKSYTVWAFACGRFSLQGTAPKSDFDIDKAVEKKTAAIAATHKLTKWGLILSLIAACILCFSFGFDWSWPLPLAFLVLYASSKKKHIAAHEKAAKNLSINLYATKRDEIQKVLKEKGMPAATSDEFSEASEHTESVEAKEINKSKAGTVIAAILTALVMIVSAFGIHSDYKKAHFSPKRLDIEIVSKSNDYDPDTVAINGTYYVYFDFEIKAKGEGIDYIELKTHVSDKDGNELGYIQSSLGDLDLKAGEKTTSTIYLESIKPENDEFFTTLYNSDFEDLRFEYEIGSMTFENGERYNNEEYNRYS